MVSFNFLNSKHVMIDMTARSKKAVFLNISHLLSRQHEILNEKHLFDAYWERERLGSTTIGHGVMIPHIRLDQLESPYGCFLRLQNPLDFDAEDKQPVDLVFGLVVPAHKADIHLKTLAKIVKEFSDASLRDDCRTASDNEALFHTLQMRFQIP